MLGEGLNDLIHVEHYLKLSKCYRNVSSYYCCSSLDRSDNLCESQHLCGNSWYLLQRGAVKIKGANVVKMKKQRYHFLKIYQSNEAEEWPRIQKI